MSDRVARGPGAEHAVAFTSELGMRIALAASSMLFAAGFFAHAFLRAQALPWRTPGPPTWQGASTALPLVPLAAAVVCLARAARTLRGRPPRELTRELVTASACGGLFLVCQAVIAARRALPFSASVASHVALVGALTALHAAYVAVGTCGVGRLAWRSVTGRAASEDAAARRVWSLYFRFVVAVGAATTALSVWPS